MQNQQSNKMSLLWALKNIITCFAPLNHCVLKHEEDKHGSVKDQGTEAKMRISETAVFSTFMEVFQMVYLSPQAILDDHY